MAKGFLPGPSVVTTKDQLGAVLKIGSQVIKFIGSVTGAVVGGEVVYTIGAGATIVGSPFKVLTFDGAGNLLTNAKLTFDGSLNAATDNIIQKFTTTERNLLTPIVDMIIFNLTTNTFQKWNGANWVDTTASATLTGTANKVLAFDNLGNLNTNSNLTLDAANNLFLINNIIGVGATNTLVYGFGNQALATTSNGLAIGDSNSIAGHIPITLGRGLSCQANISGGEPKIVVGQYNAAETFSIFEVGTGTGAFPAQRKNALDIHSLWSLTRLYSVCIKGDNSVNVISAGFKIPTTYEPSYQKFSTGSDITSDLVEAVIAPNDPTFTIGQIKIVENSASSGGSLIFKNGAKVRLPNNIDFALTPGSIITFIWNGTDWMTLSSSTN